MVELFSKSNDKQLKWWKLTVVKHKVMDKQIILAKTVRKVS